MSKVLSILGLIYFMVLLNAYSADTYTGNENLENANSATMTNSSAIQQNTNPVNNISTANQQRWQQVNSDLMQIKNKKDFAAMKQTMDEYYKSHHGIILPREKNKNAHE